MINAFLISFAASAILVSFVALAGKISIRKKTGEKKKWLGAILYYIILLVIFLLTICIVSIIIVFTWDFGGAMEIAAALAAGLSIATTSIVAKILKRYRKGIDKIETDEQNNSGH